MNSFELCSTKRLCVCTFMLGVIKVRTVGVDEQCACMVPFHSPHVKSLPLLRVLAFCRFTPYIAQNYPASTHYLNMDIYQLSWP